MTTGTVLHTVLPRSVRSALDAMDADLRRDWHLSELADRARVSSRTLQRQFRTFLGHSPRVTLQDLRFKAARRKLLHATSATKIMDVALGCGFAHCGRFSVEYRTRYGETPSQTLQRQSLPAPAGRPLLPTFVTAHQQPAIALGRIEAQSRHGDMARHLTDALIMALLRAGMAVSCRRASARYEISGGLTDHEARTELTLRLTDTITGRLIWAYRAEVDLADDELMAARIVTALQPSLRLAEMDRVRHVPDHDLVAHDLALKAMPDVIRLDAQGNDHARDLLERAIQLDPDDALATALSAWTHAQRAIYHFTTTPTEDRARATELAHKAQALPGDATVLAILGNALTLVDELAAAEIVISKALAVDGGSAWAWSRSGWINLYKGDTTAAIERFKIALDLAPHDQLAFNNFVGIGCAHFDAGHYDEAAIWQQRAVLDHPSALWIHRTLCPSYLLSGAQHEAKRSLALWRAGCPELTIAGVEAGLPPLTWSCRTRIVGALNDAGLPL